MNLKIILTFLLLIIFTACSPRLLALPGQENLTPTQVSTDVMGQHPSRDADARASVLDFYAALNQGAYAQAAALFGGSSEVLQGYNPGIDPGNTVALLEAGCTYNGLMCLPVLDLTLVQSEAAREFLYEVAFANPDGSQFVLGPCCGATEEDMPPVTLFDVRVTCEDNRPCLVLDLPPYVP